MKKKIKCSDCGSESVTVRVFDDTLDQSGRPIKETEIKCNVCDRRKTI